jgi:hypothetical protein
MKKRLTFLIAALLLTCGLSWAQTITWNAEDQGYSNGLEISAVSFDSNVSGAFFKGSNNNTPKYYETGKAIRCYGGNYFTISTTAGNLTSIALTFGTGDGSNAITTDLGSYENGTWSGEAQSVTFTIGGTSGHRRIGGFSITYSTDAPTVAAPTFSPASGTEFGNEGLQVSISCETANTAIYYTLDGSEPDDESTLYTAPFTLTSTTTVKAIAFDSDDNTSAIATATYTYVDPTAPGTLNNPYTVAQARAAIDAGTGTQGVYATGIVSAIPTPYNTQYSNITFNFVDNENDEDFLQAYRCSGNEAADVAIGDIVVVYGNLTKYGSTYEFGQGCTLVSLTHPTGFVEAPTFSPAAGTFTEAQTVTISCASANATIYYTLDGTDPTNASTQYTAAINVATTTTIKAIAYVGANSSAVTTATYSIVSIGNISDITEVGTAYMVRGTVLAVNNRGYVIGDGTGYVYVYLNAAPSVAINDMVTVSGTTATYGQIIQFTNSATVTEATTSNYDGTPAATVITAIPDYTQGYHLSTYLEFEGELTKSSNNYFITLGDAQIQISYPNTAQGNTLTALDTKNVHVKGYFTGINSSSKFTVMLESVEEVVSTEPVINADNITLTYDATSGEIAYTITNPVEGTALNATCDAEWVSNIVVGESSITFDVTENEGTEDRTATITLTYAGAQDKEVTVTQDHFVVDYATLPFEFNGGRADIQGTNGLTHEGLGTDYSANTAPTTKLKFDTTDDWLILHFNEVPGTLTFDIKGNSFSGGTFNVQVSVDGVNYEDILEFDSFDGEVQEVVYNSLAEDVRYIKWIYTTKSSGNVGLGNIKLEKPITDPVILVDNYISVSSDGEEGYASVTVLNMGENPELNLLFVAADGETPATYDWFTATYENYGITYTVAANTGEERNAYMKVHGQYNGEDIYSDLITINQLAAPQQYALTVEPFENLELITFVNDEMAMEGAGTIQVAEDAQIMLSIVANDGFDIETLMVNGVNHVDDITANFTYSFNMPAEDVTISATAAEVIPFEPVTYTLATNIESGKSYIITSEVFVDVVYAMGKQNNNNRSAVSASIEETTVTVETADIYEVVITDLDETNDAGEALYSIFDPRYNGYLYAASSGSNYLRTQEELDDNGKWTIEFGDNGVTIKAQGTNTRNLMRYNGNNDIFSCYGSGQSDIYLYVKDETSTTTTQTVTLLAGTNYFSTNVEITLDDLKAALVEALADDENIAITISAKNQNTKYTNGRWRGNLDFNVTRMYMIEVSSDCEITLEGMLVDPATPITIVNGANWIAYPLTVTMTQAEALAGFNVVNGDVISSKGGNARYTGGRWRGTINLEPGQGYIYTSAAENERTLVFPTNTGKATNK